MNFSFTQSQFFKRVMGNLLVFGFFVLFSLPTLLLAAEGDEKAFVPLVGIPFVDTVNQDTGLAGYANALYLAAISLGAAIAVLKIIFAGVKYMLTDVVTDKGQAKKDIKGALVGLIIMISAVLILNTINPQITKITALDLKGVEISGGGNNVPVQELINTMCDSDTSCTSTLCGTITQVSCINWCKNEMNGIFVPQDGLLNDVCWHPPISDEGINEVLLSTKLCSEEPLSQTAINLGFKTCDELQKECTDAGGTRFSIDNGMLKCFKTEQPVDVSDLGLIKTISIKCTEVGCSDEMNQCKQNPGGKVRAVRSFPHFYLVCDIPITE